MDWNDLRFFLALVREGSVRGAGVSLGVSHSTVARRLDALEAQLSTRLFDRHRDGFILTDAGREMLPGAERVEQEMASLERGLAGQDDRLAGRVRITCCDQFIAGILLEDLVGMCETHPDVEIVLQEASRAFNLSKREADLAVRILPTTATPPEALVARVTAPLKLANYVSTDHMDRLDPRKQGTRWLGFADRPYAEQMVAGSSYPGLPIWGEFPSLPTIAEAVHQGLGISMLPTYVGDPDPRLTRLPEADLRHVADLWLLWHPDLRTNARIRAARECVMRAFSRREGLFAGVEL